MSVSELSSAVIKRVTNLPRKVFGSRNERLLKVYQRQVGPINAFEPELRGDFALHGHLSPSGALVLGEPTRQVCDANGAWLESAPASPGDLEPNERAALEDAGREAAEALWSAGYFGPFGIDAFRWLEPGGALRFHPRCEVNARYSMGWATGMGSRRPDLGT